MKSGSEKGKGMTVIKKLLIYRAINTKSYRDNW